MNLSNVGFLTITANEQGLAKWLRLYSSDPNQCNCWALDTVENIGEATILPNPMYYVVFSCAAEHRSNKVLLTNK